MVLIQIKPIFFENFIMKNNNPLPFCETEQKLIKCRRDNHYHFGYISLFLSSIENKSGNAITFEEYTNLLDCLGIAKNEGMFVEVMTAVFEVIIVFFISFPLASRSLLCKKPYK